MNVWVFAHRVTQTSARLWVCWRINHIPVLPLEIGVGKVGGEIEYRPLSNNWKQVGSVKEKHGFRTQWVNVNSLSHNTAYSVRIRHTLSKGELASCQFETLPMYLETVDAVGDRPFTVLLGSCFAWMEDNYQVSKAFKKLYADSHERPHVKFLVGDQVYVDQPPWDFDLAEYLLMSDDQIREWSEDQTTPHYYESWTRLAEMLRGGGAFLMADDHEFWNNYPTKPFGAWQALQSGDFRRVYESVAKNLYNGIQGGNYTTEFNIGDQLSFFIADTRRNRTKRTKRFMRDSDLRKFESWIKLLKGPGVLVIGQPLLISEAVQEKFDPTKFLAPDEMIESLFGNDWVEVTDYNLPAYDQFEEFLEILTRSEHDIIVLSGDVHFGRIATTALRRTNMQDRTLVEIIASPMSLISHTRDVPSGFVQIGQFLDQHISKGIATKNDTKLPRFFPNIVAYPELAKQGVVVSTPQFEKAVSHKRGDQERTAEHFMTISFQKAPAPHAVRVTIKAWLVRRDTEKPGLPTMDWDWQIDLGHQPEWLQPVLSTMMN